MSDERFNLDAYLTAVNFQLTPWQREVLERACRPFRANVTFERTRDYGMNMGFSDLYYLTRAGEWRRHPGPRPLPIDGNAYRARVRRRNQRTR